jgi:magnesium chelatase family protein
LPLLDRIDIHVEVPALPEHELTAAASGETSVAIQQRVQAARDVQLRRQGKPNAALATREIERYCATDAHGETLLKHAISRLNLSARAYHRVQKLARSIADLAASETISVTHLAEAIQYRRNAS